MSSDSQPSFRTRIKNRVKDKIHKPNITAFIHEKLISNDTSERWSGKVVDIKDSFKNLTQYGTLKNITKGIIPNVFTSDDNQTSPKGFYDSLFSPETVNDVYLKVVIMSLWVIAVICIIPTIITIFLPSGKKQTKWAGANMIFFHIFLCEFCYLIYIFLSMINVAQNLQLTPFFCDIAKYAIDKVPKIFGGMMKRVISNPSQCSIDGRLSSIYKIIIILLFILLIVLIAKALVFSIGYSCLTPSCCSTKRNVGKGDNYRMTLLFVIVLFLNLFFSFPFYLTSMFNIVFTNINSTKTTFIIVVKICFIFRILSIILQCFIFCMFQRSSWNFIRRMVSHGTCDKFSALSTESDDDELDIKTPITKKHSRKNRHSTPIVTNRHINEDDDDDDDEGNLYTKAPVTRNHSGNNRYSTPIVTKRDKSDDDDDLYEKTLVTRNNSRKNRHPTPIVTKLDISDDDDGIYTKAPVTRNHSRNNRHSTPIVTKRDINKDDDDAYRNPKKKQSKKHEPEKVIESDNDQDNDVIKSLKEKPKPKPSNTKKDDIHISPFIIDSDDEDVFLTELTTKPNPINNIVVQKPNGKPVSHRIPSMTANNKTSEPIQPNNIKHPSSAKIGSNTSTVSPVEINKKPKTTTIRPTKHETVPSISYPPTAIVPLNHYRVTTRRGYRTITITKRTRSPRNISNHDKKSKNDRINKARRMSDEV